VKVVLSLALVAGCSFTTAAVQGSAAVKEQHELVDVALMAAAGFGCIFATVAWASPDSYAPTQDDASSWASPSDRSDTISAGQTWAPIACSAAVIFLASGLYGHTVRTDGTSFDGGGFAAGASAFAAGFSGARTQPQPAYAPTVPAGCSSDFSCGTGFKCVKRQYQSIGVCLQSVDDVGVPTYDLPDLDSVGPKVPSASDCDRSGCAAGFSCDLQSGTCVR
jgi:hypothetical protein